MYLNYHQALLFSESDEKVVLKSTGETVLKKWEKMSKSKLNGTDPDAVIEEYGIDTTRLLSMAEVVPTSTRKWPTSSRFCLFFNSLSNSQVGE